MNISTWIYQLYIDWFIKYFYYWETNFSSLSLLLVILFLKRHILINIINFVRVDRVTNFLWVSLKISLRRFWICNLVTLSARSQFRFRFTVTPSWQQSDPGISQAPRDLPSSQTSCFQRRVNWCQIWDDCVMGGVWIRLDVGACSVSWVHVLCQLGLSILLGSWEREHTLCSVRNTGI